MRSHLVSYYDRVRMRRLGFLTHDAMKTASLMLVESIANPADIFVPSSPLSFVDCSLHQTYKGFGNATTFRVVVCILFINHRSRDLCPFPAWIVTYKPAFIDPEFFLKQRDGL